MKAKPNLDELLADFEAAVERFLTGGHWRASVETLLFFKFRALEVNLVLFPYLPTHSMQVHQPTPAMVLNPSFNGTSSKKGLFRCK